VTTIEDRLRAATRAAAQTVAPDSAPPLHLPGHPSRRPAGRWRPGRRWSGWLAPLAAAAAVTAVVAGSLAISGVFRGHPATRTQLGPEQVPPYYVALTFTGSGVCCKPGAPFEPRTRAVVRATATGTVLATITPPRPYGTFIGVTGTGDGRTFVLGAQPEGRPSPRGGYPAATKFFLLRINPAGASAGGRARLAPLPIAVQPAGGEIWNFALSPQGTSLAVLSTGGVQVFNLATGAGRTWRDYLPGTESWHGQRKFWHAELGYFALGAGATNAMLSWAGSHTLAFIYYGRPGEAGIRLLDTRAPGMDLLADSRLVVPQPGSVGDSGSYWRQVLPVAQGGGVFAVIELDNHGLRQELVEFSSRTGQVLRVLNHIPVHGNYEQVLWESLSGRSLVVSGTRPVRKSPGAGYLPGPGVLTGGHFKPIPWPGQNFAAAW
jgi:hypothetical protein